MQAPLIEVKELFRVAKDERIGKSHSLCCCSEVFSNKLYDTYEEKRYVFRLSTLEAHS